jgi:hypothetical protein
MIGQLPERILSGRHLQKDVPIDFSIKELLGISTLGQELPFIHWEFRIISYLSGMESILQESSRKYSVVEVMLSLLGTGRNLLASVYVQHVQSVF